MSDVPVPEDKAADAKARVAAFLSEYGELVKKHGVDFASYPVYVPDGQGAFKVVIQSTPVDTLGRADQPKESPFVAE